MTASGKSVRVLFDAASEIPDAQQRRAYLFDACQGDAALLRQIEELFAADQTAGGFLADPKRDDSARLTLREGDLVGQYKLVQKIGEGGCGVVFMAEQTKPVRRQVALKVIKLGMDTRAVIARFEAERQVLALMDHPSIARVLDAGATETGRPFFVMELVRGIKITDFCAQNQLSIGQRLELFIEVCRAVQHAHQKGIIHRDIKPSNVLVSSEDAVPLPKVIDFGVAKATSDLQLTDKTLFTHFDMFIGTPAYMSPEQAELNAQDVDTRTDIYSLGVLLYELLAGQPPFDSDTWHKSGLDALRKTIREKEPTPPSTRLTMDLVAADVRRRTTKEREESASLPRRLQIRELIAQLRGDLDCIVLKAMDKDRTRRYATANALAMDIERHLANEPVLAQPPSRLYLLGKLARRHRSGVAVSGAVALLLVSGIVFTVRDAVRSRTAEKIQRSLREQAEANQRRAEQAKAEADAANQRLTGTLFVREWQDAEHLLEEGKVASALTWFARTVRARPDDVTARTRLLSILTEHSFALPARQPLVHGVRIRSAAMTSDGTHLVTSAGDGRVRIWDLASNTPPRMLPETFSEPLVAIVSPGNRLLVRDSASISLWEWEGVPVKTIPWDRPSYEPIRLTADGRLVPLNSESGPQFLDTTELRPIGRPIPVRLSQVASGNSQYLFGIGARTVGAWAASTGNRIWDADVSHLPNAYDWGGLAIDGRNQRLVVNVWGGSAGASQLSIWNLGPDGLPLSTAPAQSFWTRRRVSMMTFSPAGDRLFVGDLEGSVSCVDLLASEPQVRSLNCEHDGRITALSFPRDAHLLATASMDGTARLWNVRMGSPEPRIFTNGAAVWDAKFSPDSSWFAMTGVDAAEVRDTITGALRHRLPLKGLITHLDVSPDGRRIVACADSGELRVWDTQTGAQIIEPIHNVQSDYAAFSADGRWFCSVPRSNAVNLYETETGRPGPVLTNHAWGVSAIFSRDAHRLVVATLAGELEFWSLPDGIRLDQTARHKDVIWTVNFSPDEKLLLTASRDRAAALWDAATGRLVREFRHDQQVLVAAFSPDGQRILTGDGSRRAFLWDATTGRRLFELIPHPGAVWYGEFSADGRLILTGDDAGNARLWDATSGLPLSGWVKNGASLKRTHLSPDGKWALSAAETGTVRVWPLLQAAPHAPAWLPELAEALAGRRERDDGTLEQVSAERCLTLTKSLAANTAEDFYGRWVRWFLVERMNDKPLPFVP